MKNKSTIFNLLTSLKIKILLLFLVLNFFSVKAQIPVILGTGTTQSAERSTTANLGPVSQYYKYLHFQVIYTATELLDAGAPVGGGYITDFGWYVSQAPNNTIPGYTVKMANTTATNTANYVTDATTTVYGATNTTFVAGGFYMLPLNSTGFYWDGTSNVLVDICNTGEAIFSPKYGKVRIYGTANNSSGYSRDDSSTRCGITTYDFKNAWKPQARFLFRPNPATLDYIEDFENGHNWTLINGTPANKWWVGTAASNGGTKGLYISNNASGNNNDYSGTNVAHVSNVHAYRDIAIPVGVPKVGIYYDWRANGDTAGNDYFKVWLVPQSYNPVAGTAITAGAGRILLNDKQYGDNNWKTQYNENVDVTSFAGQNMRLVFEWANNASSAIQNAAAIDNVQVKKPCVGTPAAGTAVIAPATGLPSSTFNVSVTGSSAASGLSYQWQISPDGTTNWTDIPGATTANSTLTAVSLPSTDRYYRRKITCMNGGAFTYTSAVKFTTAATTYCNGTTQNANALYINSVAIVGTMADPPVNNTGAGSPVINGYSNFTTLPSIAQQAQGEGVNVLASVTGNTLSRGRWKAWVDWNGNGTFESSELIYTTGDVVSATANFGFAVPVNQDPGNYRMRIRVNNGIDFFGETLGFNFNPCENFTNGGTFGTSNYGETEDYLITVISNCSAKITTVNNGVDCNAVGGKKITLQASSSEPVSEFRWYTTATGPDYTVSLPDGSGTATTFVTPNLSATAIYYVTAFNGSCESTFRIPVTAEIKPTPEITFTPSTLEICGEAGVIAVSATGGNEIKYLIEKQTFEDASPLGVFTIQNNTNIAPAAQNNRVNWQKRQSVYIPKNSDGYLTWYSAISSGFGGNKFVMATSDVNPSGTVDKALLSPATLDSRGLTSLTLKFKMFFSRYQADGTFPDSEFVSVEVSTTNSANNTGWTTIDQITSDVGQGSAFKEKTYDLTAYVGIQNLRLRIRYYADGWFDGVAVDDIELYGEKPLQTSFAYVPSNPIGIYKDALGTIPYGGGPIETVYFKPSSSEIETYANWNVTATATLTNTCNAQGTLNIVNNTKIWNDPSTDWDSNLWKPGISAGLASEPPTLDKCVVIKKPVTIGVLTDGLAKNIQIRTGGKLIIDGSLKVNDVINNTGTARDLIVKSDGNLLQVDDGVVNTTPIAVRRIFTWSDNDRREYNYISSPVYNQNMKEIFGDDAGNVPFVTVLNEPTSLFINAKASDYLIPAKGFSVKEPLSKYAGVLAEGISNKEAEYKGVPNNGVITLPLAWSAGNRGYNVAGNPYPSNIDIVSLYQNSLLVNPGNVTALDTTFQFWDNVVNHTYTQLGGGYKGYSYALYNVKSDAVTYAPGHDPNGPDIIGTKTPSRIVKTDQAFMVRALQAGATLNFNNAVRSTERNPIFFGKNAQRDAYHLEMITAEGLGVQNAIVYMQTGSATYGREDSKLPSSTMSDALFSFAGETKIVINGRSLFTLDDVIPLGTRHFTTGTYIIRANDLEGVFANGQAIYLKDKKLNILTDISVAEYVFTSDSGEFTNRFEIVYKPEIVLATDGTVVKANIQVYRDAQEFVVESYAKKITSYELYDMSGRIITSQKTNAKEVRFNAEQLVDGAYVLKAQLEDGEIFTKKLRK